MTHQSKFLCKLERENSMIRRLKWQIESWSEHHYFKLLLKVAALYVSEHQNGTLSSFQFPKYCTKAGSNQKCITELPLVGSLGKWLYSASISNSLSEIFLNKSLPFLQHPVGRRAISFLDFFFRGFSDIMTPVRFAYQCIWLLCHSPSCPLWPPCLLTFLLLQKLEAGCMLESPACRLMLIYWYVHSTINDYQLTLN